MKPSKLLMLIAAGVLIVAGSQPPVFAAAPVLQTLAVVPHDDELFTYRANRVDLVMEYQGNQEDLIGGRAKVRVTEVPGKQSRWTLPITEGSIRGNQIHLTTDLDLDDPETLFVEARLLTQNGKHSNSKREELPVLEDAEMLALIAQFENSIFPDDSTEPVSLSRRMEELGVPAVSIAVFIEGAIPFIKAYGVLREGGNRQANNASLFQAASISKPVSVLGALILMERGLIAFDADVNDYLRSWQVPENQFTAVQPVTLRGLVTHTGGFILPSGFRGYAGGEDIPTRLQILDGESPANSRPIRVNYVPGTRFSYSGGGITVMEQLMAEAAGKRFGDILNTLVFRPLDMHHSTVAQPLPHRLRKNAAVAHSHDFPDLGRAAIAFTYPERAAAGLWTTPADLARHLVGVIEAYQGQRDDLISEVLAKEMLKVQAGGRMGFGWGIKDDLFFHGGGNEGFVCETVGQASTGSGVVVMTNSDRDGRLIDEIIATIRGLGVF